MGRGGDKWLGIVYLYFWLRHGGSVGRIGARLNANVLELGNAISYAASGTFKPCVAWGGRDPSLA